MSPINLSQINNPLGGTFDLAATSINTKIWQIPIEFIFPGDLIAMLWIISTTIAVKVSGGTDGLMEGNSLIAGLILFVLAIRFQIWDAAMISILFAGLVLGFLFFNFYPAKIRSGAVGKSSYGFLLATLSLIIGAKLVTALLILFLPLLDFTWVLIGRYIKHKPKNPLQLLSISDQTHLHYRLLHLGLNEIQVAFTEYLITIILGAITLAVTGALRAFVIFVGIAILLAFIIYINSREKRDKKILKGQDEKSPEEKYSY
jgi:UDP-GlcNAc:undecaprenyl-phosphate GlcNAc-1-phosphate transferase